MSHQSCRVCMGAFLPNEGEARKSDGCSRECYAELSFQTKRF